MCTVHQELYFKSADNISLPVTGKDWIRPWSTRMKFMGEQVYSLSTSIFPCQYYSIYCPYPSSATRTKRRIFGTFMEVMIFGRLGSTGQTIIFTSDCNWMCNRCLTKFQRREKNIKCNFLNLVILCSSLSNPIRRTDTNI